MKKTDDKPLQDYLQGEDGVRSAYDQLRQEKPSAELDARIMQAARKAIEGQRHSKKAIPYQAYSIAASVCLLLLTATLFLQNKDELTSADLESRAIPLMEAAEESAIQLEADAIQPAPAAPEIQQATQAAPAATGAQAQAEALRQETEELARQRVVSDNDLAAQAQQAIENTNQDAAATSLQLFSQEQATGLNIAPPAAQTTAVGGAPYRLSVESWLAEIQRLQATEPVQAAEEIRLFELENPDIDVDAALDALNEAIENN